MKTRTMCMWTVIPALIVLTTAAGVAQEDRPLGPEGRGGPMHAGRGGPGKPGGRPEHQMIIRQLLTNPTVAEQVGMSEEQLAALRTGAEEARVEQEKLHEELRAAATEQAELMMADDVDEKAVLEAVEKTGEIRIRIAKLRVQGLLLLKRTLEPEQVEHIKRMARRRMRERRDAHREEGGFGGRERRGEGFQRPGSGEEKEHRQPPGWE